MKKFLTTFAGVAAAFASNASTAPATAALAASAPDAHNVSAPQATVLGEHIKTIDSNGDQFNFVLKRSDETGLMMAEHSSHASHASHSSHYSSR